MKATCEIIVDRAAFAAAFTSDRLPQSGKMRDPTKAVLAPGPFGLIIETADLVAEIEGEGHWPVRVTVDHETLVRIAERLGQERTVKLTYAAGTLCVNRTQIPATAERQPALNVPPKDHSQLDLPGVPNPTQRQIAEEIWKKPLKPKKSQKTLDVFDGPPLFKSERSGINRDN